MWAICYIPSASKTKLKTSFTPLDDMEYFTVREHRNKILVGIGYEQHIPEGGSPILSSWLPVKDLNREPRNYMRPTQGD